MCCTEFVLFDLQWATLKAGTAEWRNGGMAEWRNGGMAENDPKS